MAINPSKVVISPSTQNDKLAKDKKIEAQFKASQEFEKNMKKFLDTLPGSENELKILGEIGRCFLPEPKSKITKITASFLDDSELETTTKIRPNFLTTCSLDIVERELVRNNILPHIFNANPQGIELLFNNREDAPHPKVLLTKASYREGYFSKKLDTFVCFRHWQSVSALQAAYLCGDGPFLGRKLLAYILKANSLSDSAKLLLLKEARQQLQELLNREGVQTQVSSVVSAPATSAVGAGALATAVVTAMPATAAATVSANGAVMTASTNNTVESAGLNKEQAENTKNEFADSDEFLSAIKKLINAYNAYISQYDSLAGKKQWSEIDTLWGKVCECYKRVYHYVKLEVFGPTPFNPLPEFTAEPPRGPCRYFTNDLLDLDVIGTDTLIGLYKGQSRAVAGGRACRLAQLPVTRTWDLEAISRLYKLRVDNLRNTIDHLHSLESELTLIIDVKPKLQIDLESVVLTIG